MTRSVVYLGALLAGNLYRGFTVGRFFFDCMKMSSAKDVPLETDGAERVLVAETIPLVSSYMGY